MNEKGLIEQVLRIINANYSNIYVIDIPSDRVYSFNFTIANSLVIKETMSYTEFIDIAKKFVHKDELSNYFEAISLNKLEVEAQKGNNETKVKYRKLCETGEYRWFVNIINYLPFEGRKLIFMMSEDVNDRLIDSEESRLKLENEVYNYKRRLNQETESISDAIYQINNLLDNNMINSGIHINDTRDYINSVFNKVSIDHPELNQAIMSRIASSSSFLKPTILIVDDSSIIRNSLKRIFAEDFNILFAKNGNEAISIINDNVLSGNRENNIVGILLDLVMPVSDGFTVLDYMKNNELFGRIPVAIISGDETKETRRRVYEYDIVDMLEKPFNTNNIRRRIGKIISLYISSNNLQNIVNAQSEELKSVDNESIDGIKNIINVIVNNILNNEDANKIRKIAKVIASGYQNMYPDKNMETKFMDAIVNTVPLYNIGAIAMKPDVVITASTIKQEIEYGLSIIDAIMIDEYEIGVAKNIIKYSFEAFNGQGYPDNLVGNAIPIEAQIANITVRLYNYSKVKSLQSAIKTITETDVIKYNPELIEVVKQTKKDLRKIM
ncbi:MAG: response regulator [Bacilli bacterium]|nr:response regulator [Bacilli bacterium]